MRANFVLSGVAAGLRRNATMTIALVLSTAIALGFVGAAILASWEIDKFRTTYQDKLDIQVYLCTTTAYDTQMANNDLARREDRPQRTPTCVKNQATTTAETGQIRQQLEQDPMVRAVSYISPAKAVELAKKQQPTLAQYLKIGDLPASFVVKLKDLRADYPKFAAKYGSVAGVDQVNNQIDTINALLNLIDSARWFSVVLALVVLAASILLIANTIQVAAAQRRNETSIMRLVGASRWMTELPFILETVVAAAIGGLIAIGATWLGKHFLLDEILAGPTGRGTIPNLDVNQVIIAGGAGLAVGLVLSALTAFLTLRLYVRL
jgi:cell division transport system permease protein